MQCMMEQIVLSNRRQFGRSKMEVHCRHCFEEAQTVVANSYEIVLTFT